MINTQMSSGIADAIYMAVFIGIFAVPFLAYLGLAVLGAVTLPPTKRKGAGRRLFGSLFVGYYSGRSRHDCWVCRNLTPRRRTFRFPERIGEN
jgi:hypothetical protein